MFPAVRKIKADADANSINRIQDNLISAVNKINDCVVLDGVLLTGVALVTTGTAVNHKLGRTPIGYFIVSATAGATYADSARDTKTITLVPSVNTTVSIWIF